MQVSAGSRHTLLQSASGVLYGCGCTEFGQLGRVPEAVVTTPRRIEVEDVEMGMGLALATAGGDHNVALLCPEAARSEFQRRVCATNTPISIPDLLALARACQPCVGAVAAMATPGAREAALGELIKAIHNVFSSPGLLLAGFCLPARPGEWPGDGGGERQHRLDIEAVREVFEGMLLALDSDVVVALQAAIFRMLQNIVQREEVAAAQGCTSALSQAQWLKVRAVQGCRAVITARSHFSWLKTSHIHLEVQRVDTCAVGRAVREDSRTVCLSEARLRLPMQINPNHFPAIVWPTAAK